MPDDPPLSTTVPETITIDTGASPEDINALKPVFKDFWDELDAEPKDAKQTHSAPEAPGPAQETKEGKELLRAEESEAKPEQVPSQVGTPVKESPKEYSGEDIDKFELPANARPEHQEQFKKIKELWKTDQRRAESESAKAKQYERELAEARANQLTPELKADYEHAASVRRRFDFASDPEFISRFHAPVISQYQSILDDAASMLPDPQAGAQWAAFMKEKYSPDQLNKEWWLHSVVEKIPNEMDRQAVMVQIADLTKMQKERNSEIHRRTNDAASFNAWIAEKTTNTAKRVQDEIMSEIGLQEQRIKEVLPRDAASAKTREERAAIEEHNERFAKLNQFFVNTIKDISSNGPKAWVRAAVEATRTQIMNEQIVNLEKELKEIKTERDRLKTEMEKITGARRKLTHTTGTPPTPTGAKPQNGQGLSLKDLDIRKSFQKFDWGDGT